MNATRRYTADMLNDPFFIGFDRVLNRMNAQTPGQGNYPPYNIVKVDEDNYQIQVALAGFHEDEIDVEVRDGTLNVEGEKEKIEDETEYLHRGISARSFKRSFTLSETIVVRGANFTDGILTIDLENVIPEEKKPRKIDIKREATLLKG